jgi:replicative DNA helicase
VIAGRTGKGKSALLIQAAAANASLGTRVVYVSLEMPRTDVLLRIVSAASGCPMPPNLGGSRKGKEYQGFVSAVCEAQSLPLTIHDGIADLAAIAEVIRNAARHEKAAIVIVDYLQLVECVGDTREQAVSEVARKLKVLAAQEQIAILTASQVNETGQLRESRAIGHHADGVIFIRGDSKDGTIELSKFRRGPLSVITGVRLDGPTSRFVAA